MDIVGPAESFGYKCAWLAIRASDPSDVIARLGIRDARRSSWRDGIERAYDGHDDAIVFVTPPIDDWILVAGRSLFSVLGHRAEDEVKYPSYVTSLSASLATTVQYFATHRVSESHTWVVAEHGRSLRAYSYAGDQGEVTFDHGALTFAELELGIDFDHEAVGPRFGDDPQAYRDWAKRQIDEEMVMRVAARWSIDPTTLEGRSLPQGWLGVYRG